MGSTESLAQSIPTQDQTNLAHPSTSDDVHDDGEDALNAGTCETSTSEPSPLAACSATNNFVSAGLKTDGGVRIGTVAPQLHAGVVDTFDVRPEDARTVAQRADEERKIVLGMRQIPHSVAEHDREPKATCFSVVTKNQDDDCCRFPVGC